MVIDRTIVDDLREHFTGCSRIVRTIPGQSTGGYDDRFQTADGRVWARHDPYLNASATTVDFIHYRHGNFICPHK